MSFSPQKRIGNQERTGMFETLVTRVLTSVLGNYIDPACFSSDKINVAVWSGYVVLHALEIKPEVLAGSPALRLARGVVGSIELKIPWNRLHSDSVVITIDDVYLLARTQEDVDSVVAAMDPFAIKQKLLEELYRQAKLATATAQRVDNDSEAQQKQQAESGFTARLVNKIIDNLELHVRRIHVRVEDQTTGDHPFALGVTIESVHVQSTNSSWQPSYVDASKTHEPRIYKIIELNHLSVYLNPDDDVLRTQRIDCETCSIEEFSSAFNHSIPKRFDDRPHQYQHTQLYPSHQQHHFLLKPIDASARVVINRDLQDTSVPKFEVDVSIPDVAFRLEESQYCDLLYLVSVFQLADHATKFQQYRKLRPAQSVFEAPAGAWWRYAITAVREDIRTKKQQWSWAYMKQRRDDRKKYVALWEYKTREEGQHRDLLLSDSEAEDTGDEDQRALEASGIDEFEDLVEEMGQRPSISSADSNDVHHRWTNRASFDDDASRLEEIERRRTVEDILFFRYLADSRVQSQIKKKEAPSEPPMPSSSTFSDTESVDTDATESTVPTELKYRSWGAWMFDWTSKITASTANGPVDDAPQRVLPEIELRELFKILEYEPSKRTKKKKHQQRYREHEHSDDAYDLDADHDYQDIVSRITLTLFKGSVTLASDSETNKKLQRDDPAYSQKYAPTDFLLGTFSNLQLAAVSRDDAMKVDVSLQSIEAFDESAESSAFSRLLSRKQDVHTVGNSEADGTNGNKLSSSGVVFVMSYETNPTNSTADAALFVHLEPLEIIVSPTALCWGRLTNFMNTPKVLGLWAEMEVASFNDIVNLKARTEAKLNYAMANRVALSVDLRIQAPVIVVPESDTDFDCARLIVDLGHLNFRTDRLSKLDGGNMNTGPPPSFGSSRSSSMMLVPHMRSPDLTSSTSFVRQLYDEAEKGEGSIRWKEEFYDKFSLSVTNVHVLLVPYGKKRWQPHGTSGVPSVSLPTHHRGMFDDEDREYELVERFSINVTIRTSVIPVDATLTRSYIHADLPALTFNMSMEKYYQLVALSNRFNLSTPIEASQDVAYPASSSGFSAFSSSVFDQNDRVLTARTPSFLTSSALKAFMLDDSDTNAATSTADITANDDSGESDGDSSLGSDDTWFSINSGNFELTSMETDDLNNILETELSTLDLAGPSVEASMPEPPLRRPRKRTRPSSSKMSTELLDRRLLVCTITLPLISIQLKKPQSSTVVPSSSYRYDGVDFDEEPADNGTILVKLQGFRLRLAKKTLSTQANVCFRSLEVEDYLDSSGRSTEYLLFSCPNIMAPFSMRAPSRREAKFTSNAMPRRRPPRQRERVISFQRNESLDGSQTRFGDNLAPQNLVELAYSATNDRKTGDEVLRDMDILFGSIQFNFDQSYVASMLELVDDTIAKIVSTPAKTSEFPDQDNNTVSLLDGDDSLPPLELTPSIAQEYFLPVSLTDSVRADLERARKSFLAQRSPAKQPEKEHKPQRKQVMMKMSIRAHSTSLCFSDRGEPLASIAVLQCALQLNTLEDGQPSVKGTIGDIKVFDICVKDDSETDLSGGTLNRSNSRSSLDQRGKKDYREICGLDASSIQPGVTPSLVDIDYLTKRDEESDGVLQSVLTVQVQSFRLFVDSTFIENVVTVVTEGPLFAYILSKSDSINRPTRLGSSVGRAQTSSPHGANQFYSPRMENSTPFFDAVDASTRRIQQQAASVLLEASIDKNTQTSKELTSSEHGVKESGKDLDEAGEGVSFLDNMLIHISLSHPCIVLPTRSSPDLANQDGEGIVFDLGAIDVSLRTNVFGHSQDDSDWYARDIDLQISDLMIASRISRACILDPMTLQLRCILPINTVGVEAHTLKKRGNSNLIAENELQVRRLIVSAEVAPVCIIISDVKACLLLDVFYSTIQPIVEVLQSIGQFDENESTLDSHVHFKPNEDDKSQKTSSSIAHDVLLRLTIEEIKLALLSKSEAPDQFEAWMKNTLEFSDDGFSRDSNNQIPTAANSPRRQRHTGNHFNEPSRRSSVTKSPSSTVVAEVSLANIRTHIEIQNSLMSSGISPLRCDLSFHEFSINDRISDQSDSITQLFGRVPEKTTTKSSSRDSSSRRSSMHCNSSAELDMSDLCTEHYEPQLRVLLKTKEQAGSSPLTIIDLRSVDIVISSARFILLPKTLLRIENFVMDIILATKKKLEEVHIRRESTVGINAPPGMNGSYLDADYDMSENRDDGRLYYDRREPRAGVMRYARKDSLPESLNDELSAPPRHIMSPLGGVPSVPRSVSQRAPESVLRQPTTIAESNEDEEEQTSGETKNPLSVIEAEKISSSIQWSVRIDLPTLQLWLISSDRKVDAMGLLLSSQLSAGCHLFGDGHDVKDDQKLITAFGDLKNVELLISSPYGNDSFTDAKNAKGTHTPWSIVDSFDANLMFISQRLSHDPVSSDGSQAAGEEHSTLTTSAVIVPSPALIGKTSSPVEKAANQTTESKQWVSIESSMKVNQIISRVSYRDLPLLLTIGSGVTNVVTVEQKVRKGFEARYKALVDDFDWRSVDHGELGDSFRYNRDLDSSDEDSSEVSKYPQVINASLHMNGVQLRLINNIVDQESPVVGLSVGAVDVALRSNANVKMEVSCGCTLEAWYHNLRLVTSEPLMEPWTVKMLISQAHRKSAMQDEPEDTTDELIPWEISLSSKDYLQLNLTDAFFANLMAANRAWQWVVNEGGDPREMTEYSAYWIRNNTGLNLRYWGQSCRPSSLSPGAEEPLQFVEIELLERENNQSKQYQYLQFERELYIAVDEDMSGDSSSEKRTWQTETAIPVDQVDSRMYALVDLDADISTAKLRRCECVIDVLVERGCKVFVVRSTLQLENNTASDLEVEFVPPQRRSGTSPLARSSSIGRGHIIPSWKTLVKASSIVPVPVHLVSSGEGFMMARPPEIKTTDTRMNTLPKSYAKERIYLPLFDRGGSANEKVPTAPIGATDDSALAQCTIKFHRFYSDRPVRPFIMSACLSSSQGALYHRTVSFHPPLIVHNLTAGILEFCLSTPNDWVPVTEGAQTTSASVNLGWENSQQRLRERGSINIADSLIWHLSDWETPVELQVRMKGYEWSEPFLVSGGNMDELSRIKMKDLVSDAYLYITAETQLSAGNCREIMLFVPYWIVNLTGLQLEYEFDDERTGPDHLTMLLAGQKRLDRDELLMKEEQRTRAVRRERNPHVLHFVRPESEITESVRDESYLNASRGPTAQSTIDRRDNGDRKRRHPCLLPSVPPIKGLLDLLPKPVEDTRSNGQLEVLQACHSDYRTEKGCIRLRVSGDSPIDGVKDTSQRKWSDPFVLDQTGTTGEIEASDLSNDRKYSIGYSITNAKERYSRTKVIILTPRFMLVNTLGCAIDVCHSSAKLSSTSSTQTDIGNTSMLPAAGVLTAIGNSGVVHLEAGAYADFHWNLRFAKSRTIRCRLSDYGWSWSGAIPLNETGEYAIRMRHESTRESKLVRVSLKLDGSCVCVYFREESRSAPPYRVENYSLETLRIHQHRVRRSEILLPHHSLEYAWDEPTQERMLVVDMLPSAAGDNSRPLRIGTFLLDKIQRYPDALGGTLGIEISTDGPTRVLRFTDTRLRGGSTAPSALMKTTDKERDEEIDFLSRFVTSPSLHVVVQLQGIGVSVVDGVPKELVYVSISGVYLELLMSEEDRDKRNVIDAGSRLERDNLARITACRFELGDVQVDNQLQLTPFPVLLRFSNPSARSRTIDGQVVTIPVLQLALVKHDEYAGINFIRHFSAKVLPIHIRVDGSLLSHLAPLFIHGREYGSVKERQHVRIRTDDGSAGSRSHRLLLEDYNASLEIGVKILEVMRSDDDITSSASRSRFSSDLTMTLGGRTESGKLTDMPRYSVPTHGKINTRQDETKLYFEEFHIDPIRATVSFSFGASAGIVDGQYTRLSHAWNVSEAASTITVGPLRLILNAIGTSLTKIANAPFNLKEITISHSFVQPDALVAHLASHYQSEALRQAYVILGSVDVLGNPMIAWKNLKGGFQDFINEPVHGINKGPTDFAYGMGRGTLALVRASVYTFLDFNTRILTAFSLGLSEACIKLDDYTGYPATRNIYQGFAQGISGVVVSPMNSVEAHGVRGLLPGIFAGAFGLVLKPLLGISLATSTTAATLRDAIDPNTKALLVRARPPRYIDLRSKKLKVYSYVEALGEELVSRVRGGRYRMDGYLGHVDMKQKSFLVTRKRILLLNVKGSNKYQVEWELLADEVILVASTAHDPNTLTIYYMEEEFSGRQGPRGRQSLGFSSSRGMLLRKHVVELPENKMLFVRAMLQQQERSLITKINSSGYDNQSHQSMTSVTAAATMELGSWQAQQQPQQTHGSSTGLPREYPIFRIASGPARNVNSSHAY